VGEQIRRLTDGRDHRVGSPRVQHTSEQKSIRGGRGEGGGGDMMLVRKTQSFRLGQSGKTGRLRIQEKKEGVGAGGGQKLI